MGDDANLITQICNGTHPFAAKLKNAKNPAIIVGSDLLARPDGAGILANLQSFAKDFKSDVSIYGFCYVKLLYRKLELSSILTILLKTTHTLRWKRY